MKKILAAVAVLAFAASQASALEVADLGASTLKVGSKGAAVKALQEALNTITGSKLPTTGKFGPATKAAVIAFQKDNGIMQTGMVGALSKAALVKAASGSKAPANTGTGSSTTTGSSSTSTSSTALQGGAGDITVSSTTTGVQTSSLREGVTDVNALGAKIKATGSDVAISSVRVQLENRGTTGSARADRYFKEVKIFLGSKEVGSADVSSFTKDGSKYTSSIALDKATISKNEQANLYVAVSTQGTIASSSTASSNDIGATIAASITQIRFVDGTGVTSSNNIAASNGVYDIERNISFKSGNSDDELKVMSSSTNPSATTIRVKKSGTTDATIMKFKILAAQEGGDLMLNSLPVRITTSVVPDVAIDNVAIKMSGLNNGEARSFDKQNTTNSGYTSSTACASGNDCYYLFDLQNDNVVLKAGESRDVEVIVTFKEQGTGSTPAYASGSTIYAVASASYVKDVASGVESVNTGKVPTTFTGTITGNTHTLAAEGVSVSVDTKTAVLGSLTNTPTGGSPAVLPDTKVTATFGVTLSSLNSTVYIPVAAANAVTMKITSASNPTTSYTLTDVSVSKPDGDSTTTISGNSYYEVSGSESFVFTGVARSAASGVAGATAVTPASLTSGQWYVEVTGVKTYDASGNLITTIPVTNQKTTPFSMN